MRLRGNNKGLSLIELIIAMAVAGIVLSMIILFIRGASHGFKKTNDEVNLQMEAQTAMNQISLLLMEAVDVTPSLSLPSPNDIKYLIEGTNSYYVILLIQNSKNLYLVSAISREEAEAVLTVDNKNHLLAEYVSDFSISTVSNRSVTVKLDFSLGENTYGVNRRVNLRNAN